MSTTARWSCGVANACWQASNLVGSRRFHDALRAPAEAQRAVLRRQLARDGDSRFGQTHDFGALRDYQDFARRVPLQEYTHVAPYIARIQAGEQEVLCCDDVTHLAPTSGSSGARKLIPFTSTLSRAFDAAVAPWMTDLARQRPLIVGGPAYWSVSPLSDADEARESTVPVGFADDAEYLGGAKAWLVRQLLAVPSSVRHVRDEGDFWRLTLLALLRQRELRLISVWHPSFLELLAQAALPDWETLTDAVASGANPYESALPLHARAAWRTRPNPGRASELQRTGARDWPRWWPRLQLVSCWGEQAAEPGWHRLAQLFRARNARVLVQRKGLLATEGVVTVPLGDECPLAVCSHFFEFLDDSGALRLAHELERGKRYEVVLSNGAGLWRYRLGDVVECSGHLRATPSLRFLGRAGHVSDLRGEKLSEPFVADALRSLWGNEGPPRVAYLRARDDGVAAGYELLLSDDADDAVRQHAGDRLEARLQSNPHYALARRLGQLVPLRVVLTDPETAHASLREWRGRLGDAKPHVLVASRDPVTR
ncbi:MAG: GH3 auxin-responsive promoter family protein [Gemmatimonadaceae bacterium]